MATQFGEKVVLFMTPEISGTRFPKSDTNTRVYPDLRQYTTYRDEVAV